MHAHYAVPHATAAYLAKQILLSAAADRVPQVITTLHGTDITLVGSDPSYAETVAFSIEQSDGVTAVSESLKEDTYRMLPVRNDIGVIPNFLDCETLPPYARPAAPRELLPAGMREASSSTSRTSGRSSASTAVVEIFAQIRRERAVAPAAGRRRSGSGRGARCGARARPRRSRWSSLGEQDQIVPLLSISDLFLLPSAQESFGLAALEAMACEVPVVASRVGGLPRSHRRWEHRLPPRARRSGGDGQEWSGPAH